MNLNKINLMNCDEAKTFLKKSILNNEKVFAYFRFYGDHNMNIKKEYLLLINPDSINITDDNEVHVVKLTEDIKNFVFARSKKAFHLTRYTINENSTDLEYYKYIENYFYIYILSKGQSYDYIEELELEKEELVNTLSYLKNKFLINKK